MSISAEYVASQNQNKLKQEKKDQALRVFRRTVEVAEMHNPMKGLNNSERLLYLENNPEALLEYLGWLKDIAYMGEQDLKDLIAIQNEVK